MLYSTRFSLDRYFIFESLQTHHTSPQILEILIPHLDQPREYYIDKYYILSYCIFQKSLRSVRPISEAFLLLLLLVQASKDEQSLQW